MNIKGEVKFTKDAYGGFYSCGQTMLFGRSMGRFTENTVNDEITEYVTADGIKMTVQHVTDPYTGAVRVQTSIVNDAKEEVTMEMLTSFLVPGIKADKIHRILSFWSAEGKIKTDTVTSLNMEPSWNHMAYRLERFGNLGPMPVRKYFPFLAVEDSETGHFTAVQLYTPFSWQMEIAVQHDETLQISGGIADRDFGGWTKTLKPGESFLAPEAVIAEGESFLEVCDKLVKAQRPAISPVDDHMGIAFNEYCTTWGNPTTENIKRIADKLEGMGIQYLVMDSGWYSKCGYWWDYTGDWSINKERFPNGLKEVADYIREKGMIPGIWFEFETVAPHTELFQKGEHLVMKDGVPLTIADRRFLDMEDPWVIDRLTKDVIGNLKENGYGYIKVDYNDTMGAGCDGPESMSENLRRKLLCTQDFFRKMVREIPDLVIENCSSGGHRLEPSMMQLASQASFSDAHEIPSLPIIAANMHYMVQPRQCQIWSVMRAADSDARMYYSLCSTFLGRMGLSGDIYDLSEQQWQILKDGMAFYKDVAEIIEKGTTNVLSQDTDSYNKPTGNQLVLRTYLDRSLVVFHRFEGSVSLKEYVDFLLGSAKEKKSQKTQMALEALSAALSLPNGVKESFGHADCDFSAEAILF